MEKRIGKLLCSILVVILVCIVTACGRAENSGTTNSNETTNSSEMTKSNETASTRNNRNNTLYDHSELEWYIESNYGVSEADCHFCEFNNIEGAFLLSRVPDEENGARYILHVFDNDIYDWYAYDNLIIEQSQAEVYDQTGDGRDIYKVDFSYEEASCSIYVLLNDADQVEKLFLCSGDETEADDTYGTMCFYKYDDEGSELLCSVLAQASFNETFRGMEEITGKLADFQYDAAGNLSKIEYTEGAVSSGNVPGISNESEIYSTIEFSYDESGFRTGVTETAGTYSSCRDELVYTRDEDGKAIQADARRYDLENEDNMPEQRQFKIEYLSGGLTNYVNMMNADMAAGETWDEYEEEEITSFEAEAEGQQGDYIVNCDGNEVSLPCTYREFLKKTGLEIRDYETSPDPEARPADDGKGYRSKEVAHLYLPGSDFFIDVYLHVASYRIDDNGGHTLLTKDGQQLFEGETYGDCIVYRVGAIYLAYSHNIEDASRYSFVNGIRIGMTSEDIYAQLGEAYKTVDETSVHYSTFVDGDKVTTVGFNHNGEANVIEMWYDPDHEYLLAQ